MVRQLVLELGGLGGVAGRAGLVQVGLELVTAVWSRAVMPVARALASGLERCHSASSASRTARSTVFSRASRRGLASRGTWLMASQRSETLRSAALAALRSVIGRIASASTSRASLSFWFSPCSASRSLKTHLREPRPPLLHESALVLADLPGTQEVPVRPARTLGEGTDSVPHRQAPGSPESTFSSRGASPEAGGSASSGWDKGCAGSLQRVGRVLRVTVRGLTAVCGR